MRTNPLLNPDYEWRFRRVRGPWLFAVLRKVGVLGIGVDINLQEHPQVSRGISISIAGIGLVLAYEEGGWEGW